MFVAIAAVVIAGGIALWRGRAAKPPEPVATPAPAPKVVPPLPPLPPEPPARPVAAYIGSAKCAECHAKEFTAWQHSWHAKALAPGTPAALAGNYNNAHFTGTSSEAWMKRTGTKSVMRTHDVDGAFADFPVDWVIGGKRMQDSVTVFPDGRWQVLPVYFHVTAHEWVDYSESKQGVMTPEHPYYWTNVRRMVNHECLDCHVTNMRVGYDRATAKWTTSYTDGSVACEACHGPGGHHADTQDAVDIVHPTRAKDAGFAMCARCHGPRNPTFPLFDAEHQFQTGDSYDEMYDAIVVGATSDFFADGRPSVSSFEYQAVVQSACFRKGGATCLTCHTAPHEAHKPGELRDDPDASCKTCHAQIASNAAAHAHHAKPVRCVDCHMPPTVSGVLDHFADHAIDVPSPTNTIKHGIPSACGVCHADKAPEALATWAQSQWPTLGAREARRLRLADAFDDKTARTSAPALKQIIGDAAEAPTLRGAAALMLARRFGHDAGDVVAPLLGDNSILLRAKACEAIGLAHAQDQADAVAARTGDPSHRVQLACALALSDLHDPRRDAALARLAAAPATEHLMVPHLELGQSAARRRDLDQARKEVSRAVELAPYYVDGLIMLASFAATQGDFVEAKARVAQALALEPHHKGALGLSKRLAQDPRANGGGAAHP